MWWNWLIATWLATAAFYLSWGLPLGKICKIALWSCSFICKSGTSFNFMSKKYPLPNLVLRCCTVPMHLSIVWGRNKRKAKIYLMLKSLLVLIVIFSFSPPPKMPQYLEKIPQFSRYQDGHSIAHGFCFFHVMSSQNSCSLFTFKGCSDGFPIKRNRYSGKISLARPTLLYIIVYIKSHLISIKRSINLSQN